MFIKKLSFFVFLLLLSIRVNAQVRTFWNINRLIRSNANATIVILSSTTIVSAADYSNVGIGIKKIYGSNVVLNGDRHKGFNLSSGTSLSIADITMQNFSTDINGGAISTVQKGEVTFSSATINFTGNKADDCGGAIYIEESRIDFKD
jgi:predicted outer membrane repeat protein